MIYNTLFILFIDTILIIFSEMKSTSSILQSFKMNTSVLKVCVKYALELKDRYISLKSLLQV